MQWPDAIASAADAARFEAVPAGSEGNPVGVPRQLGDHVGNEPSGSGVPGGFDLLGGTGVPVGLDLPCTDDPELFFAERPEDVERAKALCRDCQVRLACLSGALERREPWGVWGGELFLHGTVVPRKRPRGRPRKTVVAA
jgi:WhiB family transcriptional regulator, redox-sensing transcriptional regulator